MKDEQIGGDDFVVPITFPVYFKSQNYIKCHKKITTLNPLKMILISSFERPISKRNGSEINYFNKSMRNFDVGEV